MNNIPPVDEPATSSSGSAVAMPLDSSTTAQASEEMNRKIILGVVNTSHLLNHTNSGLGSVLFPVMMQSMGFDFLQLGLITSVNNVAAQGMQVVYGLLAQYFRRSMLLGSASFIVGLAGVITGFTQTYLQLLMVRVFAGVGSSAQHPLGAAILTTTFRGARGQVLGAHHTFGNVGSLIAPLLAVALLTFFDWRMVWIIVGIPSVLMAFAYIFFRDAVSNPTGSKKAAAKIGLSSYLTCLKNREVMVVSAIQMVGAAGRGTGINNTYFVPFFIVALRVDTQTAGLLLAVLQLGGIAGPIGIGWLADRFDRRLVICSVLLLSTMTTVSLVLHSQISVALFLNLLVYGAVVNARGSVTQAMIADAVPDEHADAAFSLYYFIGFISAPIWTVLTGYLVDTRGFTTAFVTISVTYLLGLILIALLAPKRKRTVGVA
ncbi:MAG: MFS transporter [Chloroflexi bacterium]|nr:MFS transporter [Chloroflexota bacterium]